MRAPLAAAVSPGRNRRTVGRPTNGPRAVSPAGGVAPRATTPGAPAAYPSWVAAPRQTLAFGPYKEDDE
jgi:hypothetical protein